MYTFGTCICTYMYQYMYIYIYMYVISMYGCVCVHCWSVLHPCLSPLCVARPADMASRNVFLYIYISIYIYIIYIIYIYISHLHDIYRYISTCIDIHIQRESETCIHAYTYIYREREGERWQGGFKLRDYMKTESDICLLRDTIAKTNTFSPAPYSPYLGPHPAQ